MWTNSPLEEQQIALVRQSLALFQEPSPYFDSSSSSGNSSGGEHSDISVTQESASGLPASPERPRDLMSAFETEAKAAATAHVPTPSPITAARGQANPYGPPPMVAWAQAKQACEERLLDLKPGRMAAPPMESPGSDGSESCGTSNHPESKAESFVVYPQRIQYLPEKDASMDHCLACFQMHKKELLNVAGCGAVCCDACLFSMSLRATADLRICPLVKHHQFTERCFLPVKVPPFVDAVYEEEQTCMVCISPAPNKTFHRGRWCEVDVCNECMFRMSGKRPLEFCFLCNRRGCFDYRVLGLEFRTEFSLPQPPDASEEDKYPGFQHGPPGTVPKEGWCANFWIQEQLNVRTWCERHGWGPGGEADLMKDERRWPKPKSMCPRGDGLVWDDLNWRQVSNGVPTAPPPKEIAVRQHPAVHRVGLENLIHKIATRVRHYWDHQSTNVHPDLSCRPKEGPWLLACPFCKCRKLKRYWYLKKPSKSVEEPLFAHMRPCRKVGEVFLKELQGYRGMRDDTAFKSMRKHLRHCVLETEEAREELPDNLPPSLEADLDAKALDPCFPPFFRLLAKDGGRS